MILNVAETYAFSATTASDLNLNTSINISGNTLYYHSLLLIIMIKSIYTGDHFSYTTAINVGQVKIINEQN